MATIEMVILLCTTCGRPTGAPVGTEEITCDGCAPRLGPSESGTDAARLEILTAGSEDAAMNSDF